jgi:hypothetical protein
MVSATAPFRIHDPRKFIEVMAEARLHLATPEECDAGRQIAADTISPNVATAQAFRRVQAYTGSSVWVHRQNGEVTGVLGMVAVSPAGLRAIETHAYPSKDPPEEFLCAPGGMFAGNYGWGFASKTKRAAVQVVLGAIKLRERFPELPFFTRAATPAGVRIICGPKMGYVPFPGAPDDLLWQPVRTPEERAA